MRQLIIHGDPGIRKDAVIELDGEELHCFSVKRQGDWHGPDEVQLWCTVGTEEEAETFARREFIPMHLETEDVDADEVTVIKAKGELAV
ncbi:HAH_0734 family protein [Halosegnis sp.]|uniref:HAH_0734 family protein n=1 Tax=Halosegnis sp. TaxID=2864959 RepID=UPI0035D494D4